MAVYGSHHLNQGDEKGSSFFYQMYRGEYEVDNEEQGYFGCGSNLWKGRLVSLIEIPLGPIRYVLDTLASVVISVVLLAVAVVAAAARFLTLMVSFFTSFAPDSTVHKIVLTGDAFAKWAIGSSVFRVNAFAIYALKDLAKIPAKLLGNFAGVIFPEIGQHFRLYKNESHLTMNVLIESFKNIEDELGPLGEIIASIWHNRPRNRYLYD